MYHDDRTQPVEYIVERPAPPRRPAPSPPAPRRRGCGSCLTRALVGVLLLLTLFVFTGVAVAGTLVYSQLSREIESGIARLDAARERETFETSRILDRKGRLLWEIFGEGKRTSIPLSQMPPALIQATIAVEDDTFYENIGLDAPSLFAALVANLRNPEGRPVGGSTITQQLVRHLAFDYEERAAVSYSRKTREIILAWMMTRQFSKDEILEMYLNEIYYGNLAYGVEAAAQTYFGKSATNLTLAEATLLAALPQSPVELDPLVNFEAAKQRQWLVLNLMASEGFIAPDQVEATYFEPLNFAAQEVSLSAPHFAVYARQELEALFGADVVANGGLRVTTTLDLEYQRLAELLARQHVNAVDPAHNLTNAALVALKPSTGEILAMLGSVDYHDDAIDGRVNVTTSPQQPGSAIKPLTYAAALAGEINPDGTTRWSAADLLWDVPVEYGQFDGQTYAPVNYDGRFHGPVRLRTALANSYNVPAVLLLQDIGVPRLLEFGRHMGINSWSDDASQYGLSLTLGGGEVTPLELTSAYAVFANGGFGVPPVAILKVENSDGEVLYQFDGPAGEQLLDPRVAFLISDILDDDAARVPAMGRNNPLDLPFPAAAKTGTTNDFRDNWTVGYTPGLVVGVWTGNTDNSPMVNISGLTGAAPLWAEYMQSVYSDFDRIATLAEGGAQPPTEFVAPEGLERRPLCAISSVTVGATDCARSGEEWFLTADEPATATAPPPEGQEVVNWERLDPAVWRVPAVPLPPAEEQVAGAPVNTGFGDGILPPPVACHFGPGTAVAALPENVQPLVFLVPPRNTESTEGAYEYAAANNLSILPLTACTEEVLAQAEPTPPPRTGLAAYQITSPKAGDEVRGVLPIWGTADFNPGSVLFYKLEWGIRQGNDIQWVTLGETHSQPVINGQLEMLHADAFPPGDYLLRLIVVRTDGNYAGEPHTIPVRVVR